MSAVRPPQAGLTRLLTAAIQGRADELEFYYKGKNPLMDWPIDMRPLSPWMGTPLFNTGNIQMFLVLVLLAPNKKTRDVIFDSPVYHMELLPANFFALAAAKCLEEVYRLPMQYLRRHEVLEAIPLMMPEVMDNTTWMKFLDLIAKHTVDSDEDMIKLNHDLCECVLSCAQYHGIPIVLKAIERQFGAMDEWCKRAAFLVAKHHGNHSMVDALIAYAFSEVHWPWDKLPDGWECKYPMIKHARDIIEGLAAIQSPLEFKFKYCTPPVARPVKQDSTSQIRRVKVAPGQMTVEQLLLKHGLPVNGYRILFPPKKGEGKGGWKLARDCPKVSLDEYEGDMLIVVPLTFEERAAADVTCPPAPSVVRFLFQILLFICV